MAAIRVLLVDDHPVVRAGLSALLSTLPDYTVVGAVADGAAAVKEAVLSRPDVILMDLRMPGMDGVSAIGELARAAPDVPVLVLTMVDDPSTVLAAMRAGARGYVLKGAEQHEIDSAIRAVVAGQSIFSAELTAQVLAAPEPAVPFPELTGREREILDRVAAGLRNGAVARELGVSEKTVANHLSSVFAKLGVDGRSEAIIAARECGLGRRR
ncbi:MAG: response regulator transcription factor [Gordonia sp. (in: high G+C Gram-positive bacteria)]|uniref:response regulator n=1 Tax=Gordonia sp. (in: high G+C Gram-positive bacteria) TaxID=84139 RepID=UPI003C757028